MALVKSGTFGSSPSAYYEIHADLLGGSGNTRQVKVHLALKVNGSSSSHYGYPLSWLPKIHTSNGGWQYVKDGTSWNGSQGLRWYNWTATVDVGTTSSTSISVGFDLKRSDGGSSSWNTSQSGSFNVGSTNVPPVLSGTIATSPSGTIPENTGTIKVTCPAASDGNGNLSGYKIQASINGGGYTQIYSGSSREYNHNVSGYGQGTTFKYAAEAYDSSNAFSSFVYSGTVTKNTFTGDTLASSSSIKYTDANSSISFTYSGAKNTGSSTKFTRVLTCDGITVHGTLPASPATVTIYRSGATPGGAYIKFDDIKNKFKNNNYQGTLVFTLKTTNEYGTVRTSSKSISVDLRAKPNPAKGHEISTTATESTIYKKVASSNSHYFLPDGSGVARVKWSAGSGKLGEAISYEIFVAYGSDSWQKVADVASGTLYYNHKIPRQTVSQQFKYLIRTKTSYGWYSDAITPTQTLHYHNPPSILVGQISRTETTAEIPVTIKSLTSIPNVAISGSWSGKGSGDLSTSQTEQKINITGLTGNGTYTITVTYNDNTGFSGNQTKAIAVGANLSIIFVNQYGLGVGGAKADASTALNTTGIVKATEFRTPYARVLSCQMNRIHTSDGTTPDNLKNGFAFNYGVSSEVTGPILSFGSLNGGENYPLQLTGAYSGGGATFKVRTHNGDTGVWNPWRTLYHTGNKPSASDVGAAPASHSHTTVGSYMGISNTTNNNGYGISLYGGASAGAPSYGLMFQGTSTFGKYGEVQGDWATYFTMSGANNRGFIFKQGTTNFASIGYEGSGFRRLVKVEEGGFWSWNQGNYCLLRRDSNRTSLFNSGGNNEFRIWDDTSLKIMDNSTGWNWFVVKGSDIYDIKYSDNGSKKYMHVSTPYGAFGIDMWPSDIRLKGNVCSLNNGEYKIPVEASPKTKNVKSVSALELIKKIEHFSYDFLNVEDNECHINCGYVAQQLETVSPEFTIDVEQEPTVKRDDESGKPADVENPMYFEDNPVIKNPKPSAIIPYITKAIQELVEYNDALKNKNLELENRLALIEKELGL